MTNTAIIPLIEIANGVAKFSQIVDFNHSYKLACIANDLELSSTGREGDPYAVKPFTRRSRNHRAMPGADTATKRDYVFTAVMPLDRFRDFLRLAGTAKTANAA